MPVHHPRVLAGILLCALTTLGQAAPPDVPQDHWAAPSVEAVTARGILGDPDEVFEGKEPVDRYAAAEVIGDVLDVAGDSGTDDRLASTTKEFEADLAASGRRLEDLGAEHDALRRATDALKRGSFQASRREPFFSGLLSAGFVVTDDGGPVGATPLRTRFAGRASNQFFTLPRVAMMAGGELRPGLQLHLHVDYIADRASRALLAAGSNVGINEAYVDWTPRESPWTFRLGGFAPTISSWEIDGRARTSTRTISPSAFSTFFESMRLVGLEARRSLGEKVQLRAAFTNGLDLALTGTPPSLFGNISDAPTIGALSRATSRDDEPGGYLDVEVEIAEDVVGRIGYLQLGGAPKALAPLAATAEVKGVHLGLQATRGSWEFLTQAAFLESDIGSAAGVTGDNDSWYAALTRRFGARDALTVRWDDWENARSHLTAGGTRGDSWTVGWVRELSERSRLQWEWVAPDEEFIRGTAPDHEDEQFQARYTVWF